MVPDTEEVEEQYNARNSSRSGVGVVMKRKNSSVGSPGGTCKFPVSGKQCSYIACLDCCCDGFIVIHAANMMF